jgi:hypothetical protein
MGPHRSGCEGFAKGIRGVAKGAQSEVSVEIHLV